MPQANPLDIRGDKNFRNDPYERILHAAWNDPQDASYKLQA